MAKTVEKKAEKDAEKVSETPREPMKPVIEDPGEVDYESILEAYDTPEEAVSSFERRAGNHA